MKSLLVPPAAVCLFGLAACQNGPSSLSSDFDPMRPPGSALAAAKPNGTGFVAGQFVTALLDQTAFFQQRPGADGSDADQLLPRGTVMKVISQSGSYLQVELDDGKIGYVPMVMVEAGTPPSPTDVGVAPIPGVDGTLPATPAADQPPGGAIPTVIPPDASSPAPLPPNGEELRQMREQQDASAPQSR